MKIREFKAEGLNGYLNFDLKFDENVNFLIGINGSGKTTVLRAIMALITPDFTWIVNSTFERIAVKIDISGEETIIECIAQKDLININIFGEKEIKTSLDRSYYTNYIRHNSLPAYDDDGNIISLPDPFIDAPLSDNVVAFLKKIPIPVFLGLDRSNLPFSSTNQVAKRTRRMRRPHSTVRSFLDESVDQAEFAASQARIREKVQRDNEANQLRENMLLTLFLDTTDAATSILPSGSDLKKYETYRRSLKMAFSVMGLNKNRVESTVDPFFSRIFEVGSKISGKDVTEIFADNNTHLRDSFNEWLEFSPRISLFSEIEKLITTFNNSEKWIFQATDAYLRIMNSFLEDSRKELYFSEDGSLRIKLPSGTPSSVHVLSSGERQLFVLITTLMFGEDMSSSVLIIDEPELSLHLKWQEMFVSAIVEASPGIQLILATHSPSVILDNEDLCIDLA